MGSDSLLAGGAILHSTECYKRVSTILEGVSDSMAGTTGWTG